MIESEMFIAGCVEVFGCTMERICIEVLMKDRQRPTMHRELIFTAGGVSVRRAGDPESA